MCGEGVAGVEVGSGAPSAPLVSTVLLIVISSIMAYPNKLALVKL